MGLLLPRLAGWLLVVTGAGSLLVVLLSVVRAAPFIALGEKLLHWGFWSDLAMSRGFADGAMFWSYEAVQIARFGAMALLTGIALLILCRLARSETASPQVRRFAFVPLLAVLVLDLWLVGSGFNPAVNPAWLDFTPPSIQFLQSKQDAEQPWRVTSLDPPDVKVMNANSAMRYGLEDVRGYDSIIPKQYAEYMGRIQPQTELMYNRIAAIYNPATLDNPLLALLGARYVVSTQPITNDGYKLVYDAEVKIYENTKAFPRAFVVPQGVPAESQTAALDKLQQVDPRQTVVLEAAPQQVPNQGQPASTPKLQEARISQRESREYFVDVNVSEPGWLVVTDNYFDGWKAYLRPFGAQGEGISSSGEAIETQLDVYRADGTFRAVYIPNAGQWTVRFVYSPRSMLLGAYLTFLAGVALILLLIWWAWGRFYTGEHSEVGTVAKNSAVQVVMNLFNRGIDFAFAMLRLRVLSPEGEGSYVFAITFYLILEIVTRFGLGTLLTRDVAFRKDQARKFLSNVILLRTGLWLVCIPVTAGVLYFFQHSPTPLTAAEVQTIGFFVISLFFANIADAVSSVFIAFEEMEYPALTATATTLGKVALGALVLLPPLNLGFVGLAGVAIVMNVVQVVWLWVLMERKLLRPQAQRDRAFLAASPEAAAAQAVDAPFPTATKGAAGDIARRTRGGIDLGLQRYMMHESWPLMINHLLATVFWRISQLVLRGAINPAAVGIFSAGIKYIDGLNVIPAYFTIAIFPVISRYAHASTDSFLKAYKLALQLLFMVALPIAVFFTFSSTFLIQVLGGAAYLPDSATALRLMIWSIPIGFVNSVTQYTLIAAKQQRFITRAFAIAVTCTTIANLVLVPRYGAIAAAGLMILAEASLFIPFSWAVQRYIGRIPWAPMLGRPLLATGANLAIVWALGKMGLPLFVALAAGFAAYVLLLLILGAFRGEEFNVLRNSLGRRLHRPTPEAAG